MKLVALTILASSVLALAACSSSSSATPAAPSAEYVGTYVFHSGSIVLTCQGAPQPMSYDLTNVDGAGHAGTFTDDATGDATFHHKDDNNCEFAFTVSGSSASTSGGTCTTIPDGHGGLSTWTVDKMTFTPTPDGEGITVQGNGTLGGCPMTINGTAGRQ
jgi:hypothetical protein